MSQPLKQRTPQQQASIDTAMQVVKTIDNLAKNDDFKRFMDRFAAESDLLAQTILHDDKLTPDEREKIRQKRMGILEVLLAPKRDREAQVRVLAQYGIDLRDQKEEPEAQKGKRGRTQTGK